MLTIGSVAHHVIDTKIEKFNYNKQFEEKITQLAILLYKLSERFGTRIIWWNDDIAPNTLESEESFIQLNDIVRKVFR